MIDSYSFGSIVINGKHYSSDVIIYKDRVNSSWWRREGHRLHVEDLEEIINQKPEVLIIGTGASGLMRVPAETADYIKSRGIELIIKSTEEACKLYNKLHETKNTIAALHLTC
jgi:hypothetical protein